MPIYNYKCSECEEMIEVFHFINDSGPHSCPQCEVGILSKTLSDFNVAITKEYVSKSKTGDLVKKAIEETKEEFRQEKNERIEWSPE